MTNPKIIVGPKRANPVRVKAKKKSKPNAMPWYLRIVRFCFSTLGPVFPKFFAKQGIKLFSTPRIRAKHKVSDLVMEQAKVFEFMFKGKILKAYEWGSGPQTILLVHGWESRGTALRSFVPILLEKGYKVVAFDAPAHGNSAGKQTDLVEFAGSIKAIINQIGGVYGIIAHSFGGASTIYALSNLEQTQQLKRLILVASPSRMVSAMDYFLKLVRAPKIVEQEFYKIITSRIHVPLDDLDTAKMYDKVDVEKVMVIHDKEDQVVRFEASERLVAQWPGATFVVTEGFGHYELVKDEEVLALVGRFVARV